MSKPIKDLTELFICACNDVEHQIIMRYNADWNEVYASIHLVPEYNIFKRIWKAIKYIFGYKCRYGNFEEFVFKAEDADKLQNIVDYLKYSEYVPDSDKINSSAE
jgi:hypothetical protein